MGRLCGIFWCESFVLLLFPPGLWSTRSSVDLESYSRALADERDGPLCIPSSIFLVIRYGNQSWRLHVGLSHRYRRGNTTLVSCISNLSVWSGVNELQGTKPSTTSSWAITRSKITCWVWLECSDIMNQESNALTIFVVVCSLKTLFSSILGQECLPHYSTIPGT
jgi:hypothetical protein